MKKLLTLLTLMAGFSLSALAQPQCNASMTWSQVPNSQSITFTNTSTASATPSTQFASTARWIIIGNQWYASNPTYTHSFPAPGTYQVVAMVNYMDSVGGVAVTCQDTAQYTVVVAPSLCFTTLAMSNTSSNYTFTASTPGGTPGSTTYNWWIHGTGIPGNGVSFTGNPITYTFPSSGTYAVTVTATNGNCIDTAMIGPLQITAPLNCALVSNSFSSTGSGVTRTFFPSTLPAAYSRTNYWNFNNGSPVVVTSGSTSTTASFPGPGVYNVCLVTVWHDSANNISCADTACQNITITGGGGTFNCANASSTFTASVQSSYAWFQPGITPANATGVTISNLWNYGDGTTGTTSGTMGVGHAYAQSGTYTVCLTTRWMQAGTTTVLCSDTTCQTVTVTLPNVIYGYISVDSLPPAPVDTFKVWLITYNANTSMLTAVDSTLAIGIGGASFQFTGKPAGVYRTKAHKLNQAPSAFGYVPTYRDSSLTWSGAQTFNHNNGYTYSGAIYMRHGLVTSGPGFVGGSVLSGANKGTADGDPVAGQLVFLRDAANGSLVQSAYTNAAGQYSFSNIPLGTYYVYPEEMNYTTTPSASLTLTASSPSTSGIVFKKDDVERDIKQVATNVRNLTSGAVAFTVAPNPTSGKLMLTVAGGKASAADVRVVSVTGQVVFSKNVNTAQNATLDLSHLPAGVYTVTVATEAGIGTARAVIAR